MESGFSTVDVEIIFASDLSCAKLVVLADGSAVPANLSEAQSNRA
jgi:hypothetical protein